MLGFLHPKNAMSKNPSIHMWINARGKGKPQSVDIEELPRCTEEIQYAQAWPVDPAFAMGLFTFEREKVRESVCDFLKIGKWESDEHLHPFDLSIVNWLADVDFLAIEPIRLPQGWAGMENALFSLIEGNEFKMKCLGCARDGGAIFIL